MKIGDKVKIIYSGKIYPNYDTWRGLSFVANTYNKQDVNENYNNFIGTVICLEEHHCMCDKDGFKRMLALVRLDSGSKDLIVGIKGLQVINNEEVKKMTKFKIGDKVKLINRNCLIRDNGSRSNTCKSLGQIEIIRNLITIKDIECINDCGIYYALDGFELVNKINKEETKMKLENIKKESLKQAKKQYDTEKTNSEIEFAKNQLRNAQDEVNRLDRNIKSLEEEKQPHLDIIKMFKA